MSKSKKRNTTRYFGCYGGPHPSSTVASLVDTKSGQVEEFFSGVSCVELSSAKDSISTVVHLFNPKINVKAYFKRKLVRVVLDGNDLKSLRVYDEEDNLLGGITSFVLSIDARKNRNKFEATFVNGKPTLKKSSS